MCKDCGCQEGNENKMSEHTHHDHTHEHDGHTHSHSHDHHTHEHNGHSHSHQHDGDHHHHETKVVAVEKNILAHNDKIAADNNKWLKERGVTAINFISSPGAGKTFLLEKTLEMFKDKVNCAVITGDQKTDNDAKRLEGKGAEVRQIETHSSCHLNAEQIKQALPEIVKEDTKLLFIENVGNLVCPAAFNLGEDFKIAILSTTEGEDKPIKYPVIFNDAKAVIISKTDLIPHLEWDLNKCRKYIQQINPGVYIFELSAKTGDGMDAWLDYLMRITG